MRLVQFLDRAGARTVGVVAENGTTLHVIGGAHRVYDMATEAIRRNIGLAQIAREWQTKEPVSYEEVIAEGRLLPPLDHADAARWLITGTGLSHLGSAAARDSMHVKLQQAETELTDSMKMFKWGLEGGKPKPGEMGVQPEWFYKGDGRCVVAPGHPLELPPYALDGGDEVEVVGLYIVADDGTPWRVGFALGNEYADHVMERQNYLYLAHSKLRQCSYGPELLRGRAPCEHQGDGEAAARKRSAVERRMAFRRRQHGSFHRQPRASPLQVPGFPPTRAMCTCTSSARPPAASRRT